MHLLIHTLHDKPVLHGQIHQVFFDALLRIAQQFGLDSSVRVNVSSVVYSTSSAVNLAKNLMRK